ncbi:hypothetical protein C1E24_12125 [Pseudoalteromonas phenolica]|uniref:Glutaredoxin domain-containing protein n=1 Tax=Pseudoalteromonas phenolica TaxID=161398 RepID=A0A5R9Q0R8_9GAMM|nr:glutaredoxin family protein [Pseudoalteromonas phenolica]TLX46748.1 hypothetical protein C1E24_12125 [Pseudoalteromonas phenolica]
MFKSSNLVIKSIKSITILILIALLGWFGGSFASSYLNKQDSVIKGDYSALLDKSPVLYVATGCPACKKAKEYIDNNNLNVEIRNISSNPKWLEQLNSLEINTVPTLLFKEKLIIGFSEYNYQSLDIKS